ncbi:hypothetical protein BUE93_09540 [Chromobacterium amazonense]|uniref:Uncharacterized protein n=1 Tax=Chromobacterium amazonense TaxID=1382803 RepID=A0A2S9X588_9NEIS|nr:hypothetical protein [Chromobacterium amazonense]PRP70892.1 hypothetical protein BUE93_09540 [Chromobacterium amazonense]
MPRIDLEFRGIARPANPGDVDLVFSSASGPVNLAFSGLYAPPPGSQVALDFNPPDIPVGTLQACATSPRAQITLAVEQSSLPLSLVGRAAAAHAHASIQILLPAALVGTAASPRSAASTGYDVNVWRGKCGSPAPGWHIGLAAAPQTIGAHETSARMHVERGEPWQDGARQMAAPASGWIVPPRTQFDRVSLWQLTAQASSATSGLSRSLLSVHARRRAAWEIAVLRLIQMASPHQVMITARGDVDGSWQPALRALSLLLAPYQPAMPRPHLASSRFQHGRLVLGPGWWAPKPPPIDPPRPGQDVDLDFRCELLPCRLNLDFALRCCNDGPDVIPAMRTYLMTATVILTRERDGLEIPALAAAVSLDAGTALWGVEVTLPEAALRDLAAREVMRLSINGHEVLWLAERWSRSRQFGGARAIRMTGRSVHAELDAPLWPAASGVVSAPTNARQLADQALEMSGYTLDWKLPDWLVPAGAWSWEQMTPLARVARLAEAAGGMVIGAPDKRQLLARPLYSAAPWAWGNAMPQLQLPEAVLETLSEDWDETPAIDSIIVTGERTGVLARVKRAGTAGASVGETIIDPLVTDSAAARARGLNAIAQSGRSCRVSISLPVFSDTRLALPGDLVAVTGGDPFRAMVRGVRISAERRSALVVRQTLDMERRA